VECLRMERLSVERQRMERIDMVVTTQ
jgi:hypothetical protein